jgi:hypothetical protein
MTATMDAIRQRLAEIQASVTGVKRAYVRAPQSLADSDLPAFCTFVGLASINPIGETLAEEVRTWLMRLYVKPILSGIDGEAEKAAEEFLIQVRNTFLSHPQLGKGAKDAVLSFVEKVVWLGDNGIQILPYAGQNYLGVEFRMNIVTIVPLTIAKYE